MFDRLHQETIERVYKQWIKETELEKTYGSAYLNGKEKREGIDKMMQREREHHTKEATKKRKKDNEQSDKLIRILEENWKNMEERKNNYTEQQLWNQYNELNKVIVLTKPRSKEAYIKVLHKGSMEIEKRQLIDQFEGRIFETPIEKIQYMDYMPQYNTVGLHLENQRKYIAYQFTSLQRMRHYILSMTTYDILQAGLIKEGTMDMGRSCNHAPFDNMLRAGIPFTIKTSLIDFHHRNVNANHFIVMKKKGQKDENAQQIGKTTHTMLIKVAGRYQCQLYLKTPMGEDILLKEHIVDVLPEETIASIHLGMPPTYVTLDTKHIIDFPIRFKDQYMNNLKAPPLKDIRVYVKDQEVALDIVELHSHLRLKFKKTWNKKPLTIQYQNVSIQSPLLTIKSNMSQIDLEATTIHIDLPCIAVQFYDCYKNPIYKHDVFDWDVPIKGELCILPTIDPKHTDHVFEEEAFQHPLYQDIIKSSFISDWLASTTKNISFEFPYAIRKNMKLSALETSSTNQDNLSMEQHSLQFDYPYRVASHFIVHLKINDAIISTTTFTNPKPSRFASSLKTALKEEFRKQIENHMENMSTLTPYDRLMEIYDYYVRYMGYRSSTFSMAKPTTFHAAKSFYKKLLIACHPDTHMNDPTSFQILAHSLFISLQSIKWT